MEANKKIKIICGPTSTGKTSLALKLAPRLGAEIISADSRQMVKFMDIGTGKLPINLAEHVVERGEGCWKIDGVSIWGYDLIEPGVFFSVYDWAEFALSKTRDLLAAGKEVLVVGGTGFFLDIFTGRVTASGVLPDPVLRKELEGLSLDELLEKLKKLNSQKFEMVDRANPRRVLRAIEVEQAFKVSKPLNLLGGVDFEWFGLRADSDFLFGGADAWAEAVWWGGLVEETQKLIDLGYASAPQLTSFIYKTVQEYIRHEKSEEEAIQRIKFDLHAYIRRQLTYFKKNSEIKWFDISKESTQEIADKIIN